MSTYVASVNSASSCPHLKCFPSSGWAEAGTGLSSSSSSGHPLKLANWALPPIASGQPVAARMPRSQPPRQLQCLWEAGCRLTAPREGSSRQAERGCGWPTPAGVSVEPRPILTHTPWVAGTQHIPGSPSGRCEQGGQTREPSPPLLPRRSLLAPACGLAGHLRILLKFFRNHRVPQWLHYLTFPPVRLRVLTLHVLPNVSSPDPSIAASAAHVPLVKDAASCSRLTFVLLSRRGPSPTAPVDPVCKDVWGQGTGGWTPECSQSRHLNQDAREAPPVCPCDHAQPIPQPRRRLQGPPLPCHLGTAHRDSRSQRLVRIALYSAHRLEVRPSLCLCQQFPCVSEN